MSQLLTINTMAYNNAKVEQCLAMAKQIVVVLSAVAKGQAANANYQPVLDAVTNGTDIADALGDAAAVIIASTNPVLKVNFPVT